MITTSSQKKSILVVAYQFCPKGRVGTRRWSKFSKILANRGYNVHVICAKYPYKDKVNWCHDVENNPNIHIHQIDSSYPAALLSPNRTLKVKVLDAILRNTFYYIDAAQQWQKPLIKKAIELIDKLNISNIFITGAPFSCLYHGSFIKNARPNIQLILDYRDPWNDIKSHIKLFPNRKKKRAEQYQRIALDAADKILVTSEAFKQNYSTRFPSIKEKIEVIYNGYDEQDYQKFDKMALGKKFNLIYPGEFNGGRIDAIQMLTEVLSDIDDDYIKEHLQIDVFSPNLSIPNFADKRHIVTFKKHFINHQPVPQQEIFKQIEQHAMCFSINAKMDYFVIGAKTFDYMGLNRPIFHIAPHRSELSKILGKNKQYITDYNKAEIADTLIKAKEDFLNNRLQTSSCEDFDLEKITNTLEGFIV